MRKMRNLHGRTLHMGRNTENVEIEKNTLQDLEYDDKIEKH
jgi:hypothetical protein